MDAISSVYDRPIRFSLVCQVAIGIIAALTLDFGVLARVVLVAILAYWLCVVVVVVRRPHNPSPFDLRIVRWGLWPVLVVACLRQALSS